MYIIIVLDEQSISPSNYGNWMEKRDLSLHYLYMSFSIIISLISLGFYVDYTLL